MASFKAKLHIDDKMPDDVTRFILCSDYSFAWNWKIKTARKHQVLMELKESTSNNLFIIDLTELPFTSMLWSGR